MNARAKKGDFVLLKVDLVDGKISFWRNSEELRCLNVEKPLLGKGLFFSALMYDMMSKIQVSAQ